MQLSSSPVRAVRRSASSLATGSTPGRPRQTGQTLVLGGAPNSLAQPHHIFDFVLSWTCVSSPMMRVKLDHQNRVLTVAKCSRPSPTKKASA